MQLFKWQRITVGWAHYVMGCFNVPGALSDALDDASPSHLHQPWRLDGFDTAQCGDGRAGARRFKSKGKAGGDTQGASRVEPYAYWPLDRKMLNRRPAKKAAARQGLESVVHAAKSGAAKGRKAKRQKQQ